MASLLFFSPLFLMLADLRRGCECRGGKWRGKVFSFAHFMMAEIAILFSCSLSLSASVCMCVLLSDWIGLVGFGLS